MAWNVPMVKAMLAKVAVPQRIPQAKPTAFRAPSTQTSTRTLGAQDVSGYARR